MMATLRDDDIFARPCLRSVLARVVALRTLTLLVSLNPSIESGRLRKVCRTSQSAPWIRKSLENIALCRSEEVTDHTGAANTRGATVIGEEGTDDRKQDLNVDVGDDFLLTINGNSPVDDRRENEYDKTEV